MRTFIGAFLAAGLIVSFITVCGCAGSPASISCKLTTVITVNPTSATVNHAAAPPANQVQFVAYGTYAASGPNCAAPALAWTADGTWSNPDPTDIQISSANDSTNGTAVCMAPTNGPVTLTGTFGQGSSAPITKTVQLTCN